MPRSHARTDAAVNARDVSIGAVPPAAPPRVWKVINPLTRSPAGFAPWWVLLETTGRRTGKRRLTPLAGSPFDGSTLFVLAGYGEASAFVKNLLDHSSVRVRRRGRWLTGTAELIDPTPDAVRCLGRYARWVLMRIGSDPKIVKVTVR